MLQILTSQLIEHHFVGGDGYCVYDMNDKDVICCNETEYELIEYLASKKMDTNFDDKFKKAI